MAKNALNHFANMLYEEANTEKEEMIAQLEGERNQQLSQVAAQLAKQSEAAVKKGTSALKQQKRLSLTRRETELHKMLLENRQRTFDTIFDAVEENIRAFMTQSDYKVFFQKQWETAYTKLTKGEPATAQTLRCTVMPRDLEMAKAAATAAQVEWVTSETDIIGGFLLENTDRRQLIDCSFQAKIEEQKTAFYEKSGFMVE